MEEREMTLTEKIDMELEELWEEFKIVPLDDKGNLKNDWYGYKKGTNKSEVYGWFAIHYSKGITYLMKERKEE